ncbi:MAG: PQQ-binding-like beta-propeller repeat protein [Planctomycetales bacterium]|nr:PQQ-binding-like beta-propeller repeat protein [Planctomycetales bacterium]
MKRVRTWLVMAWLAISFRFANADDWQHWRGPNRNGITSETSGWRNGTWLSAEPRWRARVGEGSTSPLVVGDRVFVMGWNDQEDTVRCLDANTGRELWLTSYACPRYGRQATGDEGFYAGPTSTPEYDPSSGLLYTLSCDGDLQAWDTRDDGRGVWQRNLYDSFSIPQRPRVGRSGRRDYGYTTAPLIYKDWVLVEVGAETGTIMAFSKATGELAWQSAAKGSAGHTGGLVLMQVEGIPCVAALTFKGLLVTRLDPNRAGETVAEYEWITNFANNIATPAVSNNQVLITSGYNHNTICKLEVSLSGVRKVWEQPVASKVCSPIIHDGRVYWAWQRMRCLDFETGQTIWEGGNFGDAGSCILTADDRLVVWGGRGRLALVETAKRSPREYRELFAIDRVCSDDVWPHVVLSGGQLFCKDRHGNLLCFK